MVKKLKTFSLEEEIYNRFSQHCKTQGISMSKKIENFLKEELAKLPASSSREESEHPLKKYC